MKRRKQKTKRVEAEEVAPHAGRMATSLQGMGYDFQRALADIVDNSITAGAQNIWIDIRSDLDPSEGIGPYVLISDDGKGMSRKKLVKSMQYGSESSDEERALGRFGLGLKTASTSQANRLTVASRRTKTAAFFIRSWDMGYLRSRGDGKWVLLEGELSDFPRRFRERMKGRSGTGVLWRELEHLLPDGGRLSNARLNKRMNKLAIEATKHLGLVFHRFLSGTAQLQRKVNISVNEKSVQPFDPLLPKTAHCRRLSVETFSILDSKESCVTKLRVQAAILPRQEQFTTDEEHKRAGGPNGWNAAQGFYVYRLDRLIQGGGWSNMRANDEHTKLARVAVDLDRSADSVFRLNVSKTRVLFPASIAKEVKEYTAKVAGEARKAYSANHGGGVRKGENPSRRGNKPITRAPRGAGPKKSPASAPRPRSSGSTKQILRGLYACCKNSKERSTLLKIIERKYPGFEPRE